MMWVVNGSVGGGPTFQPGAQSTLSPHPNLVPWEEGPRLATGFTGTVGGLRGNAPPSRHCNFDKREESNLFLRGFSDGVLWQSFQRCLFIRNFSGRWKCIERRQICWVFRETNRGGRQSSKCPLMKLYRYLCVRSFKTMPCIQVPCPMSSSVLQSPISPPSQGRGAPSMDITAQSTGCQATLVFMTCLHTLLGFWIVNTPICVRMLKTKPYYLYKQNSFLHVHFPS